MSHTEKLAELLSNLEISAAFFACELMKIYSLYFLELARPTSIYREWDSYQMIQLLSAWVSKGQCETHFGCKCQQIEHQLWTNAKVKRENGEQKDFHGRNTYSYILYIKQVVEAALQT